MTTRLSIGDCVLGERPRVAVAVRDGIPREEIDAALRRGGDLLELRVDQFRSISVEAVVRETERLRDIPCIGTIRYAAEGGGFTGPESERLSLFETLAPRVGAVDIELSADELLNDVIALAHQVGIPVIGSFHDFKRTPDRCALDAVMEQAVRYGVDIAKIAVYCADMDDLRCLTQLLLDYRERPLILMGMGAAGMASRVFFPVLGSLIAYTFLGTPSAPGQLNLEDTVRYLRLFSSLEDE